jgi:hypothetical protein
MVILHRPKNVLVKAPPFFFLAFRKQKGLSTVFPMIMMMMKFYCSAFGACGFFFVTGLFLKHGQKKIPPPTLKFVA